MLRLVYFSVFNCLGWHLKVAVQLNPEEGTSFLDGKSVHLFRVTSGYSMSMFDIAALAFKKVASTIFDNLDLYHASAASDPKSFWAELRCDYHTDCR
jgi:hypothetical protein